MSGEVLENLARTLHLQFDYPGSMKAYEHLIAENDLVAARYTAAQRTPASFSARLPAGAP